MSIVPATAEVAADISDEKLLGIIAGQRTGLPGPGFGDSPGTILVEFGDATLKSKVDKANFAVGPGQLLRGTSVLIQTIIDALAN